MSQNLRKISFILQGKKELQWKHKDCCDSERDWCSEYRERINCTEGLNSKFPVTINRSAPWGPISGQKVEGTWKTQSGSPSLHPQWAPAVRCTFYQALIYHFVQNLPLPQGDLLLSDMSLISYSLQPCANFANHDNRRVNFWLTNATLWSEMRLYFSLWMPTIALKGFWYKLCCLYPQSWPTLARASVSLGAVTHSLFRTVTSEDSLERDAFPAPPLLILPQTLSTGSLADGYIRGSVCAETGRSVKHTAGAELASILLINAWLWRWERI